MFTILLDKKKSAPLYDQLYQYIRSEITNGNLCPGEKLPSKRKLAAHLKISQNTVETAYGQLQSEGYITSISKRGFFVEEITENLLLLPKPTDTKAFSADIKYRQAEKPDKTNYDYDFKTNIVNTDAFPFDTWSKVVRSILADNRKNLLKPLPFLGNVQLRTEIARYLYDYRGIKANPEQIVVGAGSEYLLTLLIQLLGYHHTFAIENPGYDKIQQIFQNHNLPIDYINTTFESLEMESLSNSHASVLHITPSHHFPLGCVMPLPIRLQTLSWANQQQDRYIIEDDYDSEFRFAGRPIPALASLDNNEKVIYLNTFTKSLAPSLRISYMVLPHHLRAQLGKQFSGYASSVPSFEQSTLAAFMARGHFEQHLNRMKRIYKGQKDQLIQTVQNHPLKKQINIIGEDSGLHLLLQINIGLSERRLTEIAAKNRIHITGLSTYYHKKTANMPTSTVVLGYGGLSPEEIKQGMKILLDAWQEAIPTPPSIAETAPGNQP